MFRNCGFHERTRKGWKSNGSTDKSTAYINVIYLMFNLLLIITSLWKLPGEDSRVAQLIMLSVLFQNVSGGGQCKKCTHKTQGKYDLPFFQKEQGDPSMKCRSVLFRFPKWNWIFQLSLCWPGAVWVFAWVFPSVTQTDYEGGRWVSSTTVSTDPTGGERDENSGFATGFRKLPRSLVVEQKSLQQLLIETDTHWHRKKKINFAVHLWKFNLTALDKHTLNFCWELIECNRTMHDCSNEWCKIDWDKQIDKADYVLEKKIFGG